MKYLKKLYGTTVIDSSDSAEIKGDHKIELEYYKTKSDIVFLEDSKPYGVEIIKKEVESEKIDIEKKVMNNICHQEQDTNKLLEILIHNKVTPIALEDIITDIQSV